MNSSGEDSRGFVDKCSNWVIHMLRAKCSEGAQGLYFRTAEAAAAITAAKHAVVVVPSKPGMLRVAGCCGLPTAKLEEFSDTRGIIGRAFREEFRSENAKRYLIVDDVREDKDYYSFDDRVKSELVVPIFDFSRKTILAIINVESYRRGHFKPHHAELIFKLAEVMIEYREHLLLSGKLQKQTECFYKILENVPDELMVIDKNYQPIYANKAKRKQLRNLAGSSCQIGRAHV